MKPFFTFEYGARLVVMPNNKERNGYETFFDVTKYQRGAGAFINGDLQKPNGIQLVSRGEAQAGIVDDPAPRLAPRLSFAWDLSRRGTFVLRGGYGLFYNRSSGNFQYSPALQNAPNYINPIVRFDSATTAFKDGVQDLTSQYHSGQLTLSRQRGNLTYTAAYTFSKALGIFGGDGGTVDPLDERNRSYGVQAYDRTHNLVVNYNWNLPRLINGKGNKFVGGLLNGWQISGISTLQSGAPIRIFFSGGQTGATGTGLNSANAWQAWFGTNAFAGAGTVNIGGIAPILTRNPQIGGSEKKVGDKLYDISAIDIPAFGQSGAYQSPFYSRLPGRNNHDVTLMKNFRFKESKNIQIRGGFFNIFNQAFVSRQGDVDMTLQTDCRVRINGIPNGIGGSINNVCDPTGGYFFNDTTLQNFGKVITKRGNRRVQLQFRFTF